MILSSIVFLSLFLPVALLGYALTPRGLRNAFLVVMSLLFYAWAGVSLVGVLLASSLADHVLLLPSHNSCINY